MIRVNDMKDSSAIPGLFRKSPKERLEIIGELCSLAKDEKRALFDTGGLPMETADSMIENVVGAFVLPLGVATNFLIDGEDVLVPMAVEEPSVVAAASKAAKIARACGGFTTSSDPPRMIGQIQVLDFGDMDEAVNALEERSSELIEKANTFDPVLVGMGGGAKGMKVREIRDEDDPMIVIHLLVDCRDAMGANAVNTMTEGIAPMIEEISGGRVLLRIISNLAVHRMARAKAVFPREELGDELVDNIILAQKFAEANPYRAATHNKGIMNGISAVVRATGNDTRAVEAGAHSYAALSWRYGPLTTYDKDGEGNLVGRIELPVPVGLVGGATRSHPQARACIKILGVNSASRLGRIIAAVGLAQNFAALRALASEGIQSGHMRLHARNVAVAAGAKGRMIDTVAARMREMGEINENRAREILEGLGRLDLTSKEV